MPSGEILASKFLYFSEFLFYVYLNRSYGSQGFPGGSDAKAPACSAGDPGSISESGRSPGEGNGYPLQYSCLENFTDRRAWWATVHGFAESDMTNIFTFTTGANFFSAIFHPALLVVFYHISLSLSSLPLHWK